MPIPRSLCPTCGYLNGDHVYPAAPPVMMCLNCGATNCFDEKFRLVTATPEDMAKLNIYQREIIVAMQKHVAERGPIMKRPEKPS